MPLNTADEKFMLGYEIKSFDMAIISVLLLLDDLRNKIIFFISRKQGVFYEGISYRR